MIQEQRRVNYHFIKGEYASIKIKMEPQSLLLDIPLEWQMDKIKCLLIKIIFKLDFDMFAFHHDGEEIPGDWTLRNVIEHDRDGQCVQGDHYVLTFVKNQVKTQRFEKYYLGKMKPLIKSLEASPFQPILHPAYYQMKYLNHINHIPIEGGRELIVNFNQLQQMQNVMQQQRRENQNVQNNLVGVNMGGNIVGENGNQGGWEGWIGLGVIRFIQIISVVTILQFLFNNSNMNVFIIIAFIFITYFAIEFLKKTKNNRQVNPVQTVQQAQSTQQDGEELSFLAKLYYKFVIFMTIMSCQILECTIAYLLALFPNWTVQAHREWFKATHDSISLKINQLNVKLGPEDNEAQASLQEPQSNEPLEETDQDLQVKTNEETHRLHEQ